MSVQRLYRHISRANQSIKLKRTIKSAKGEKKNDNSHEPDNGVMLTNTMEHCNKMCEDPEQREQLAQTLSLKGLNKFGERGRDNGYE